MPDSSSIQFLGDDYLLGSETARELYREIRDLPIVDAHNHADIVEVVDNRPWTDIWQVEGATDHYVWEMMRKRGVSEEMITGEASNHDKWLALAGIFPQLVGNAANWKWLEEAFLPSAWWYTTMTIVMIYFFSYFWNSLRRWSG